MMFQHDELSRFSRDEVSYETSSSATPTEYLTNCSPGFVNRCVWHNGTIDRLKSILDTYDTESHQCAYISLGGKYNEPVVSFTNPAYLSSHGFPSNTQYQMFPMFTRFLEHSQEVPYENRRSLIVIVDCFDNEESLEINQKLIDSAIRQFGHLDVVVYDTTLHIQDIRPFIQMMVDWLSLRRITPEKCVIANYIRFRGCSSIETSQLEVDIPRKIHAVLSETNTYVDCFYQWFGYQYYTYNLLYLYRKYDMSRHLKVIMLFHECAEATQVVSDNASHLFFFDIAREPTNKTVLVDFMKHTLDITSYGKTPGALSSKMSDYLGEI